MRKNFSKKHGVNSLLNRSQSAMEYLMTYGWAILIIAIVLVALFSLGIFNSSNFSPRAQPGSCEVLRNSAQTSLVGQCNGMLPEYVAQFNGATGSIEVANSQSLSPTSSITITVWVKLSGAVSNWASLNTKTYGSERSWWFGFSPGSSNTIFWSVNGDNNCALPTSPLDSWQFIAVTYNSTSGKLFYENSALISSCSYSQTGSIPNTVSPIYLVGDPHWDVLNGTVANEQVYNATLSTKDIQALYQEGIGGAPINVNNLVGWWPLNGNANDYSGNDNNGVPTNITYTSAWTSGYSAP